MQGVLRPGKILKGVKEPMEKNFKPKVKVAKNRNIQFGKLEYPIFIDKVESK
jgi:hypothetical protein